MVVASGEGDLSDLCGVCSFAGEVADRDHYTRVLIDLLGVTPNLDGKAHAALGHHFASRMKHLDRTSVVIPLEYRSGIGELIVLSEGVRYRLFDKLEEATDWLLQP